MSQANRGNKKEYIPPQMKVYKSLKDITAVETCFCTDVNCPIYCMQYVYPLGGFWGDKRGANPSGQNCPRS